jgi:uncharacterized membrane protein
MHTALTDYGPTIETFTDILLARIEKNQGTAVNFNDLCIFFFSYDVMSSLAFGDLTRFTEESSTEDATKVLYHITDGIQAIGTFLHVPWVSHGVTIPLCS